jgi:hypothetical protein
MPTPNNNNTTTDATIPPHILPHLMEIRTQNRYIARERMFEHALQTGATTQRRRRMWQLTKDRTRLFGVGAAEWERDAVVDYRCEVIGGREAVDAEAEAEVDVDVVGVLHEDGWRPKTVERGKEMLGEDPSLGVRGYGGRMRGLRTEKEQVEWVESVRVEKEEKRRKELEEGVLTEEEKERLVGLMRVATACGVVGDGGTWQAEDSELCGCGKIAGGLAWFHQVL